MTSHIGCLSRAKKSDEPNGWRHTFMLRFYYVPAFNGTLDSDRFQRWCSLHKEICFENITGIGQPTQRCRYVSSEEWSEGVLRSYNRYSRLGVRGSRRSGLVYSSMFWESRARRMLALTKHSCYCSCADRYNYNRHSVNSALLYRILPTMITFLTK